MKLQRGGGGGERARESQNSFSALQCVPCLPGRLCVAYGVCVCVSVCGLSWKHVLAAFCVNVRRTWGRSHYHPPYPPLLTPPRRIYSQHPLASTHHSFSLPLYHGKQHIATQPERDSQKRERERKKKKACRKPAFCCFYASKNRQDKRTEPNGLNMRAR